MAWSVDKFLQDYDKDECQNARCKNQVDLLVERGSELREERMLVKKINDYVKENLPQDLGFPILEMIARHNLGETYGQDVRRAS